MARPFEPGDPVRLTRSCPETRWARVVRFPLPLPEGKVCVRFPTGFWGLYPPERLRRVSEEAWGLD